MRTLPKYAIRANRTPPLVGYVNPMRGHTASHRKARQQGQTPSVLRCCLPKTMGVLRLHQVAIDHRNVDAIYFLLGGYEKQIHAERQRGQADGGEGIS